MNNESFKEENSKRMNRKINVFRYISKIFFGVNNLKLNVSV